MFVSTIDTIINETKLCATPSSLGEDDDTTKHAQIEAFEVGIVFIYSKHQLSIDNLSWDLVLFAVMVFGEQLNGKFNGTVEGQETTKK